MGEAPLPPYRERKPPEHRTPSFVQIAVAGSSLGSTVLFALDESGYVWSKWEHHDRWTRVTDGTDESYSY